MVSAPTAILGNKLPLHVKNIHNPSLFFSRTLFTVADYSNMVSYINSGIITNPKAQDFSSYPAKQPYSSNSISFCSQVPFSPFLMYEWSRNAAHIFTSISTFKDINQSCLSPRSVAKQKLGNISLFSKIQETGVHVHRCTWCNVLYQRAHFFHEESSKQMKLGSTSKKQQKNQACNMIQNCCNSIYALLCTFAWSINQDKAEIVLLPLFSGRRNANILYIKIHFWALLETYASYRGGVFMIWMTFIL